LRRKFDELDCDFAVREALQARPFCRCSFGIAAERHWEKLPETLLHSIRQALAMYRDTLINEHVTIVPLLEKVAHDGSDEAVVSSARDLIETVRTGDRSLPFSVMQIQVLQKALGTTTDTHGVSTRSGAGSSALEAEMAHDFENEIVTV
jgi:hypothetical protein